MKKIEVIVRVDEVDCIMLRYDSDFSHKMGAYISDDSMRSDAQKALHLASDHLIRKELGEYSLKILDRVEKFEPGEPRFPAHGGGFCL